MYLLQRLFRRISLKVQGVNVFYPLSYQDATVTAPYIHLQNIKMMQDSPTYKYKPPTTWTKKYSFYLTKMKIIPGIKNQNLILPKLSISILIFHDWMLENKIILHHEIQTQGAKSKHYMLDFRTDLQHKSTCPFPEINKLQIGNLW